MPITAGQISISPDLSSALGQIGSGQQSSISDAYAKRKKQLMSDARPGASDMFSPGSYASGRFGSGKNLSMGNLKTGLESVLGNTSYQDWKSQRDFQQSYELAKLSGELMKPSTLEQVLGGLGGAAQAGGQFMGLYNSMKRAPSPKSGSVASSSGAGASGYDPEYGYYYL